MNKSLQTAIHDSNSRIAYIDSIRAYSIVLVIFIHAAAPVFFVESSFLSTGWWVASVYDSFCRPCVPLFVMISGALLLNPHQDEGLFVFFKKRLSKILIPFFVWGLIYLLCPIIGDHEYMTIRHIIGEFFRGPVHSHLWFIYTIIGLYLVTPILRVYSRNAKPNDLLYFCILWFIFSSIFPLIEKLVDNKLGIVTYVVTGFVGYFILGYYLHHTKWDAKLLSTSVLIVLIYVIFTAIATYLLNSIKGQFQAYFHDYFSPNVIIASIYSYIFFQVLYQNKVPIQNQFLLSCITSLSSASFGIYFVHMIVLAGLASGKLGFSLSGASIHPIIGIPLTGVITTFVSLSFVLFVKKIPYLKFIVP